MIVGPNWKDKIPAGITAIVRSSTDPAFPIPRIQMDDTAEDKKAIQAPLSKVMFYPLSQFDGKMKTTDWSKIPSVPVPAGPPNKWVNPETYFDQLPAVLKRVPALRGEQALYGQISAVFEDSRQGSTPSATSWVCNITVSATVQPGYRQLIEAQLLFPYSAAVGEAHRLATLLQERLPGTQSAGGSVQASGVGGRPRGRAYEGTLHGKARVELPCEALDRNGNGLRRIETGYALRAIGLGIATGSAVLLALSVRTGKAALRDLVLSFRNSSRNPFLNWSQVTACITG